MEMLFKVSLILLLIALLMNSFGLIKAGRKLKHDCKEFEKSRKEFIEVLKKYCSIP